MASPYSYELRVRVMALLEEKMSVTKISHLLKVSRDTIYKWKYIKEITGDVKPKIGYQSGESRKIVKDKTEFLKFIRENEGKSIRELAELMPNKISPSTIKRTLRKFHYSYKKNLLSPPKRHDSKRGL